MESPGQQRHISQVPLYVCVRARRPTRGTDAYTAAPRRLEDLKEALILAEGRRHSVDVSLHDTPPWRCGDHCCCYV